MAPLVIPHPGDDDKSVYVFHPRAVYESRAEAARLFAEAEKKDDTWKWSFFRTMSEIGNKQMMMTKKRLAEYVPTYLVVFETASHLRP